MALRLSDGTVCRTGPTCRLHGNLHTLQEQVFAAYEKQASKPEDLTKKEPTYIDEKLSAIYEERYRALMEEDNALQAKKRAEKNLARYSGDNVSAYDLKYSVPTLTKQVETYEKKIAEAQAKQEIARDKMQPYEDEYNRRGGWHRAFFVANGNGHVHSSMGCSTCYPTTRFQWLTGYSGKEENEIVGDAGERACTVCYSSAPVELRNQPSKINDPEKEAARLERANKKALKDAAAELKGISNPDGSPLIVNGWKMATVRTAEIDAVSNFVDVELEKISPDSFANKTYLAEKKRDAETVLVALAHKYGTTVDQERDRLAPKIAKKVKAIQKVWEARR